MKTTRRRFLKTSAFAALAVNSDTGVSPVIPTSASAASPISRSLTLGFNTYGTQALSTETAIDVIKNFESFASFAFFAVQKKSV